MLVVACNFVPTQQSCCIVYNGLMLSIATHTHTHSLTHSHAHTHTYSGVQCLLQKRGLNSASPNKWSFPGGRLENPGDLDEDGDVGTRRELEEECGGGEPLGLPSLIHIECYKSGKVGSLFRLVTLGILRSTTQQTHTQNRP